MLLAGISTASCSASPCCAASCSTSVMSRTPHSGLPSRKAGVEYRVGNGGVLAVPLEGAIEEEAAAALQVTSRACEQALGDAPGCDVDDIGAEYRRQLRRAAAVGHRRAPGRIGQIDRQRRADVGKARMGTPRLDALQMRFIEIARPPGDAGRMTGEIVHDVLAGAAAGFQHVAGLAVEELFQHSPDRRMVAVEGRGIEPAVRLDGPAVLARFPPHIPPSAAHCLPMRQAHLNTN